MRISDLQSSGVQSSVRDTPAGAPLMAINTRRAVSGIGQVEMQSPGPVQRFFGTALGISVIVLTIGGAALVLRALTRNR